MNQLRFHFEENPPTHSAMSHRLQNEVSNLLHGSPFSLSYQPLGNSAGLCSSLYNSLAVGPQSLDKSEQADRGLRLVRIELAGKLLLRCVYDPSDLLHQVHYSDGVAVQYEYDERGRVESASSDTGWSIQQRWDNRGRLVKRSYNEGSFVYDYEQNSGDVQSVRYPDGHRSMSRRDTTGLPLEVDHGHIRFALRWNNGRLASLMQFGRTGNKEHDLPTKPWRFDVSTRSLPQSGKTVCESAFGAWGYERSGRLFGMAGSNGAHNYVLRDDNGRIENSWSVAGQESYERDEQGRLCAIQHEDGARTVFVALPEHDQMLDVSPLGVRKYIFDANGRAIRVQGHDGTFALFNYCEDGALCDVTAPDGRLRVRRKKRKNALQIDLPRGRCTLRLNEAGLPEHAHIEDPGSAPLAMLAEVAAAIWRCQVLVDLLPSR